MTNVVTHEEFNEMNKWFRLKIEELEKKYLAMMKPSIWIDGEEACDMLKCSISTLRRLRIEGEITSYIVRGKRLYNREEIDKYIRSKKKE